MTGKHERERSAKIKVWPLRGRRDRLVARLRRLLERKTKRQPVLVATVASVLVSAGLKFGLPIDDELANWLAGIVVAAAIAWVRSKVTPVAAPKLPAEVLPDLQVVNDDGHATPAEPPTNGVPALLQKKGLR